MTWLQYVYIYMIISLWWYGRWFLFDFVCLFFLRCSNVEILMIPIDEPQLIDVEWCFCWLGDIAPFVHCVLSWPMNFASSFLTLHTRKLGIGNIGFFSGELKVVNTSQGANMNFLNYASQLRDVVSTWSCVLVKLWWFLQPGRHGMFIL